MNKAELIKEILIRITDMDGQELMLLPDETLVEMYSILTSFEGVNLCEKA